MKWFQVTFAYKFLISDHSLLDQDDGKTVDQYLKKKILNRFNHPHYNFEHQPLQTFEDFTKFSPSVCSKLNCCIPTKNLFLVDRKKNFFMITSAGNAIFDFKVVSKAIGSKGRVKLANEFELQSILNTGIMNNSFSWFHMNCLYF